MGSISNNLSSVSSSLLSEIKNYQQTLNGSRTSTSAASSDQSNVSQTASLFKQLQQLQTSNQAEFKQVLTDGAKKLEAAAAQTTDSTQSKFLSDLASRFQQAASNGNLTPLEPSAANGAHPAVTGHGHHHHAHHYSDADPTDSTASTPAAPTSTSQTLASYLQPSTTQPTTASQLLAVLNSGAASPISTHTNDLLSSLITSA